MQGRVHGSLRSRPGGSRHLTPHHDAGRGDTGPARSGLQPHPGQWPPPSGSLPACRPVGGGERRPPGWVPPPQPGPSASSDAGHLFGSLPKLPVCCPGHCRGWGQHGPGVAVVRPVRAHAQATGVWGGRAVPGSGAGGRGDRGKGAPTPSPLHFATRSHLLIDGTIFNQPASTSVIFHSSHRYPTKTLHA